MCVCCIIHEESFPSTKKTPIQLVSLIHKSVWTSIKVVTMKNVMGVGEGDDKNVGWEGVANIKPLYL